MTTSWNRPVVTDLQNILSLVVCAEDYGYGDDVFMDAIAGLVGRWVTDEEVEGYVSQFITPEFVTRGYGEEDAEVKRGIIIRWRDTYCTRPS